LKQIDRIMEKFAERFTEQNKTVFPTADAAFILSFSIIMLNTDLHNPAIKEERRMTREGFVRNNRGICDGQDLPEELLTSIFDRIKQNPISLKEDEDARERIGDPKKASVGGLPAALNPASFFSSHYNDMDRARETNFQKERDHIVRTTESLLKRRRHVAEMKSPARTRSNKAVRGASRFVLSGDSGLRDEYVAPMFEVTWGPALAAFSTAMESANGTVGALISIASDEELELAAENAAETIEVCLTGFRFAVGIAGLCGNSIARDAYMLALSRFSQLGTGVLLEPRHIRCVQTMLSLAREDGELLGGAWEHVFKALSEVNRFHQVFQLMARNDRVAALAAERRRRVLEAMENKREARERLRAAAEDGESIGDVNENLPSESDDDDDSLAQSDLFTDDENYVFDDHMDSKAVDEANAREIYEAVSEATIEAIYERSSSLSAHAVKEFVVQLCLVSRAEISVGTNNRMGDINQVAYRQKHALLNSSSNAHASGDQFHHTQPNIYNLQKLVEVTHYNMVSRPRLLFSEIWLTVADHLTDTALHSNPAIAMYAVDSFRQLSIQYLQRDELEVFEFQRRFLKPLETIMALSKQTSTKELLLNCVARLMHVFGTNAVNNESGSKRKGGLRSGWVPILTILGIGGRDDDKGIAQMSFSALSGEIKLCLHEGRHQDVLLNEHFVETVNALLMIVGGPHDKICIQAIDQLTVVTDALANGSISPPQMKRKSFAKTLVAEEAIADDSKHQLEFWWPVLLGLSRTIGDSRYEVRSKSLEALFGIINKHFFPSSQTSDWENLQLIFRGVLNSVLDFAETSSDNEPTPGLPDDFERTSDLASDRKLHESHDLSHSSSWLETTFEAFMDACVDICLRSMALCKESVLIEEIFAILNSCLLSDSGALAVRGLRRLEQFVTSDLHMASLTDDIWATVSHMLQRCLTVRNLPKRDTKSEMDEHSTKEIEAEYGQEVLEFVAEDRLFSHRRFIGSNATMVVGLLLCSERFSIGLRWRLFLIKWLHRGVREWDSAAAILSTNDSKSAGLPVHL
jgi:brefeldin A-inhibited guanine nucleotide-exchange protein